MRRIAAFFLVLALLFSLSSCTTVSDFYGVWYREALGKRDVLQFAENAEGKSVLVWAIYNIEEDTVESTTTGYYRVSGDQLVVDYKDGSDRMTLYYEINGDQLTLSSDTVSLKFQKFELD